MYLPKQFKQDDVQLTRQLMCEHPFATLVSVVPQVDAPYISQLPIVPPGPVAGDSLVGSVLLGHLAKPNPHSKVLGGPGVHQLLWTGPNAYMSPSVYPDLARVPTWTYISVLATVQVEVIEQAAVLDALLKTLIAQHEPPYALQWRGLDSEFQDKLLSAIIGYRFTVTHLEAKFKLNQHRPESHQSMAKQLRAGNPQEQALATWMQRLGMV
jgi:transcriptional regulator